MNWATCLLSLALRLMCHCATLSILIAGNPHMWRPFCTCVSRVNNKSRSAGALRVL